MAPASSLSAALNTVVCHDGYISPSLDNGHHCIGATFQPDNESLIEEKEDHVSNQHTLGQHMPELAEDLAAFAVDGGKSFFNRQEVHEALAAHAVLRSVLDYDAARFAAMRVRFTAPVFPGDTLRTELWVDGDVVSLRSSALERGVVVLDKGRVDLRPVHQP